LSVTSAGKPSSEGMAFRSTWSGTTPTTRPSSVKYATRGTRNLYLFIYFLLSVNPSLPRECLWEKKIKINKDTTTALVMSIVSPDDLPKYILNQSIVFFCDI
jgi:hypothetical protein